MEERGVLLMITGYKIYTNVIAEMLLLIIRENKIDIKNDI